MTTLQLPRQDLNGAEEGVSTTGSRSGTAREFTTQEKAEDDADFFADAYEG